MPYTVRVRGSLAQYLLAHPNEDLRRRLSMLRGIPYPPGSRSLLVDADWSHLATRFEGLSVMIYGTSMEGVVYAYNAAKNLVVVELAILGGQVVP